MTDRSQNTSTGAVSQDFSAVFSLLKPHMAALDVHLRAQIESFEPEIREMADYCIDTSGKRIRPALVFMSGWREGEVTPDLVRIAAVVELVHLASLVHDDIMDGAELRRNRPTATRTYGPTPAVLLGDALFSHALKLATQFPTTEVCGAIAESMRRVCAGEIIQTMRRGSTNISHADYQRIIELKTAELFRVSCVLGARYGGYPADFVKAAETFGRSLGVAYQIFDDLADFFGDEKRIGKTLGTDLASGKITLPLEVLLSKLPEEDRAILIEEITGNRPAQGELRIRQMRELGVYPAVVDAVRAELAEGEKALAPFANEPPTTRLLQLCGVLLAQVTALKN